MDNERKLILLIDDSVDFRENFQTTFGHRFNIVEAATPEKARETISENRFISLIVLDLELRENSGEYDGQKLIPVIQKLTAVPIIVITGEVNPKVVEISSEVTTDGALLVLSKEHYDISWAEKFSSKIKEAQNKHSAYALINRHIAVRQLNKALELTKLVLSGNNKNIGIDIQLSTMIGRIKEIEDARDSSPTERKMIIGELEDIIREGENDKLFLNYYPLLSSVN